MSPLRDRPSMGRALVVLVGAAALLTMLVTALMPAVVTPLAAGVGSVSVRSGAGDGEAPLALLSSSDPKDLSRSLEPPGAIAPEPDPSRVEQDERFLGVVLADESVDILAAVEGRVLEMLVRPGDRVAAGGRLAVLDSESLGHRLTEARGSLALIMAEVHSFEAQLEQSRRQLERRRSVSGLYSKEDLESSEMLMKTSGYRFDVAKAEEMQGTARVLELERQVGQAVVRAPFAGVVAQRFVDPGTLANRGTPLLRLVSPEASRLRFAVPPARAAHLEPGMRLRLEVASLGRHARAVLERRAPEIDAASELVFFEARLEAPMAGSDPALPPGSVARVAVEGPVHSPGSTQESTDGLGSAE